MKKFSWPHLSRQNARIIRGIINLLVKENVEVDRREFGECSPKNKTE
jgi:hypothetical protein